MAENLLDEMSFEFIASSKGFVTMITSEPLFRMECTDMFPYQGVFREFLQKTHLVLIFIIVFSDMYLETMRTGVDVIYPMDVDVFLQSVDLIKGLAAYGTIIRKIFNSMDLQMAGQS